MSDLTINDFRGAMGKYNLGSLKLEGTDENQKLTLVNNHNRLRSLRNTSATTEAENTAVRELFAKAIEKYLAGLNLDTSEGSEVGKFIAAIREDLLGEGSRTRELSRQDDVARILDKLDAAVALKDFGRLGANGPRALHERFLFGADVGNASTFSLGDAKATRAADQTLASIKDLLTVGEDGAFVPDEKMLKMAMKAADISDVRATTYLLSRADTLLVLAEKHLHEALGQMDEKDLKALVSGIGKADLARLVLAQAVEDVHADTVSAKSFAGLGLSGNRRRVANTLKGLDTFDAGRLAKNGELNDLLSGLSRLASGEADQVDVKMLGHRVTLAAEAGAKELGVTLDKARFTAFGGARTMLKFVEDAITDGSLSLKDLKSVYGNKTYLGDAGTPENVRRMKLLNQAVVMAASKVTKTQLESVPAAGLSRVAQQILKGTLKGDAAIEDAIIDEMSTIMYSEETLKMVETYQKAPADVQNKVTIAPGARKDSGAPALNRLAADLFANADVWVMDETRERPGARLQATLRAHAETLVAVLKGEVDLDTMPQIGGAGAKNVVEKLVALLRENGVADAASLETFVAGRADVLAGLEADIDVAANAAIDTIQDLFAQKMGAGAGAAKADTRELWEKSLDEVIAEQQTATGSVEAKFLDKLFRTYLKEASGAEKRGMMASLLALTTQASTDVEKLSAVLKGAGPVFQKMLQGFPEASIPADLHGVFADMKSHLAPIPDTVVKAMLSQIVASDDNDITSITLDKTLGSATVGQAFLCTFTHKDGRTDQAVVKMLKPDVQNRYNREIARLRRLAADVDRELGGESMAKTLEGRLTSIAEELNFTIEARNVQDGQVYDKEARGVGTIKLYPGVPSQTNMLVLTVAEGETFGDYMASVDDQLAEIRGGLVHKAAGGGSPERYIAPNFGEFQKARTRLVDLAEDIARKQRQLQELAQVWIDEAIFGKGFIHADMHGDNLKTSPGGVKVLDYGSAMRLTGEQMKQMKILVCATGPKNVDEFQAAMSKLLAGSAAGAKLKDDAALRGEVKDFLTEIYSKGGLDDTDAKLYAAMNKLMDSGVEIPRAVYGFCASQNRLKNAIAELGRRLDAVKDQLARTTLDFDAFVADKYGRLAAAFGVPGFLPAVKELNVAFFSGFSPKRNSELADERVKLQPEGRAAVVDAILKTPNFIDGVVAPAVEFFRGIGADDAELGRRLAAAQDGIVQNRDNPVALRAGVAALVDVLHEVQLKLIDHATRTGGLPENVTLGQAYAQVIQSKIYDATGKVSTLKALGFAAQIGKDLAYNIRDRFEAELDRQERARKLDTEMYASVSGANNYSSLVPLVDTDLPVWKAYVRDFRISAATRDHLLDGEFSFAENAEARQKLMKELATNVKAVYIAEARRARSPRASQRGLQKTDRDGRKRAFGEIANDKDFKAWGNSLQRGEITGLGVFGSGLLRLCTNVHWVQYNGLFEYLADAAEENGTLREALVNDIGDVLALSEDDVTAIAEARLSFEAELRDLDFGAMTPEAKKALREEVVNEVKADFALETASLKNALVDFILMVGKGKL